MMYWWLYVPGFEILDSLDVIDILVVGMYTQIIFIQEMVIMMPLVNQYHGSMGVVGNDVESPLDVR